MHTEAKLLEDAPLPLDHLVLQVDVVLVEKQRRDRPTTHNNAHFTHTHTHSLTQIETFLQWVTCNIRHQSATLNTSVRIS